jgi:hypothetical protein
MKTYTIYHIPGKKIGCTDNLKERLEEQGYEPKDCKILEIHTDIYIASDRELELQTEYGYAVDRIPYYLSIEHRSKGGKIQGKRNVESGHFASLKTKEHQINAAKVSGKIAVETGRIYDMAKLGGKVQGIKNIGVTIPASIPISAYRKETGEYVGTYPSFMECYRKLNTSTGDICNFFKGKLKSVKGYTFKKETI